MGKKTREARRGITEVNGHAQAEDTRLAYAEGPEDAEGGEAEGDEDQGDVDFVRTDSALRRLVTEPGETWVLETDQSPDLSMAALATWSQTRGVTLLVFGAGERFSVLATKPGDTVVLFTANPAALNAEVLSAWAQSRGLQLAVMPNEARVELLDEATLDQMGLQKKNRLLVLPGGAGLPRDLKGPA